MKILVMFLFIVIALTVAACATAQQQESSDSNTAPASASNVATPALPASLSGRFYTPDNMYSQIWGVTNRGDGTGLIYYYANKDGCSMFKIPVKIEYDGVTLRITATGKMPCATRWEAILTRKGTEFEGVIHHDISTRYHEFNTTIK